jgi:hypothetical protein
MSYHFPVIELFDRLAIAEVKWIRTHSNQEELDWYRDQTAQFDLSLVKTYLDELKDIHDTIWSLEAQLKSGCEAELSLEEIGRRAILIRDWNNKRVAVKNTIAEILNCPVREIKQDHLSQNV